MASIYINGKCYHVVHNRLEENHNFNNKYDYAENDAHTLYTIEFTRNKAVFDKIGDANFDFEWYDIMEYDSEWMLNQLFSEDDEVGQEA